MTAAQTLRNSSSRSLSFKLVRVAVGGDRLAFDVLHHEVRQAVVGRAAVDQARDVRMIELRQDLPFGAEAPQNVIRIEAAPDEFERDLLAVFVVGPGGEIDRAKSAPADLADDL